MPDKVTVGNTTGQPNDYDVATDTRSIGGQTVDVQQMVELGNTAINSGRATVTTTAAVAVAARETRKRVVLLALSSNTANIDVGDSATASGSAFQLAPGASLTLYTTADIYADSASGSQVLAFVEEYDS